MGRKVAAFYKKASRGKLILKTSGHQMKVSMKGSKRAYNKAVRMVKSKYKADLYMIPGIFTGNHAGSKVAYLRGAQYSTAIHEVGHLLGLGHAGRYELTKGRWKLDHYGDGKSAMSRYPSGLLTAPQYYDQGWTPKEEVGHYSPGGENVFTLKQVGNFKGDGAMSVVKVPAKYFHGGPVQEPIGKRRDAYISFPTGCKNGCVAIHLSSGGASQKIKTFGREYFDKRFTGLHITKTSFVDGKITIKVDFEKDIEDKEKDEMEMNLIQMKKMDIEGDHDPIPACIHETESVHPWFTRLRKEVKKFRQVQKGDREALVELFSAFKKSLESGIHKDTSLVMMQSAEKLRMDVCRVKVENDSRLVFTKKPGIRAHSGANFMLREINPSKVVVFGPHDGGDGTYASTKFAFENTRALAGFYNSYHRKLGPKMKDGNSGDMARQRLALGFVTMDEFFKQFRQMLVFHWHGQKARSVLFRSRKTTPIGKKLDRLFPKAVLEMTTIKKSNNKFNAYYEIDKKVKSKTYVKIEFPATRHRGNPRVLARILNRLLEYPEMESFLRY